MIEIIELAEGLSKTGNPNLPALPKYTVYDTREQISNLVTLQSNRCIFASRYLNILKFRHLIKRVLL